MIDAGHENIFGIVRNSAQARNLCDAEDGFLRGKKYLLMDRDTKFSEAFRIILEQAGVEAVRLPARSPNLNPNLERFM